MEILLSQALIDRFDAAVEKRYKRDKGIVRAMRAVLERCEKGDLPLGLQDEMGRIAKPESAPPVSIPKPRRQTLKSKVLAACEEHQDRQWTAREMVEHLRSIGFPVIDTTPSSVSGCLWGLAYSGRLTVVRRGVGSTPSIYQWKGGDATEPEQRHDGNESGENKAEETGDTV